MHLELECAVVFPKESVRVVKDQDGVIVIDAIDLDFNGSINGRSLSNVK